MIKIYENKLNIQISPQFDALYNLLTNDLESKEPKILNVFKDTSFYNYYTSKDNLWPLHLGLSQKQHDIIERMEKYEKTKKVPILKNAQQDTILAAAGIHHYIENAINSFDQRKTMPPDITAKIGKLRKNYSSILEGILFSNAKYVIKNDDFEILNNIQDESKRAAEYLKTKDGAVIYQTICNINNEYSEKEWKENSCIEAKLAAIARKTNKMLRKNNILNHGYHNKKAITTIFNSDHSTLPIIFHMINLQTIINSKNKNSKFPLEKFKEIMKNKGYAINSIKEAYSTFKRHYLGDKIRFGERSILDSR